MLFVPDNIPINPDHKFAHTNLVARNFVYNTDLCIHCGAYAGTISGSCDDCWEHWNIHNGRGGGYVPPRQLTDGRTIIYMENL